MTGVRDRQPVALDRAATLADAGSRLRLQLIGIGLRQVFDLKPGHGVLDCAEVLRRIDQAER